MEQSAPKKKPKSLAGKIWYFLWVEDSILSWLVSIVVAFIFIKFIFYPSLGLIFATPHPVVAVVSGSMEHSPAPMPNSESYALCGMLVERGRYSFNKWWSVCGPWYQNNKYNNITKDTFEQFPFSNGFNKGDIMVLRGKDPQDIQIGEILVYQTTQPYPIIHRIIDKRQINGQVYFTTKGDHNADTIKRADYEESISQDQVLGVAVARIPLLGYVKIIAVDYIFSPIVNIFK